VSDNIAKWQFKVKSHIDSDNYNELYNTQSTRAEQKVYFKLSSIHAFCGGIVVHTVAVGGGNPAPLLIGYKEEIKEVIFKYLRSMRYTFAVLADKIQSVERETNYFTASTLFDKEGTLSPIRKNLNSGNDVQMCIVDLTKYDQIK
jgi:hypothetical protein